MEICLSAGLREQRPELVLQLNAIKRVAVRLDHDIRVSGLRVEAQRSKSTEYYSGWAYPEVRTRGAGGYVKAVHPDGRITLYIGAACVEEDIVRLYAHELRHIGQFHRGRARFGVLTTMPLDAWECEQDAQGFETRLLERY